MRIARIFQVDAFTSQRFAGNPAAVVLLDAYPPDTVMQAIAAENNLAETAFLVSGDSACHVRWFTPVVEVPLCGHATLASAAVILERLTPELDSVTFASASGPLHVRRHPDGYAMDFPARHSNPVPITAAVTQALGTEPLELLANEFNYLAVLTDAAAVRTLTPDLACVARLDRTGMIITARGDDSRFDIVSRYFAPRKGIGEDPVTGAAHCMLAPFWAPRLSSPTLRAHQASARGGELQITLTGDRVELVGSCVFYLEGTISF